VQNIQKTPRNSMITTKKAVYMLWNWCPVKHLNSPVVTAWMQIENYLLIA